MKSKTKSSRGRSILAHTVLILLSFMCLFFFYVSVSYTHLTLPTKLEV